MEKFMLLMVLTAALAVLVLVTGDRRTSCVHQMVAGGSAWCQVDE